jgi:hypothetical protein
MGSGFKLALLAIFGIPSLFRGFKYACLGAYRGLVARCIPMGEDAADAATGAAALAIGVYSLLMIGLLVAGSIYLVLWMFAG